MTNDRAEKKDSKTFEMDVEDIKKVLPHRYPFLLVDRVLRIEGNKAVGIKNLGILVKGVGSGRDAALRSFAAQGFDIYAIRDITPVPHNGPRPKKARRV